MFYWTSNWNFLLIKKQAVFWAYIMIKHKFNDEKQQKLPKKYLEIDISILYIILNSPSFTRDVTCSKL